MKKEEVFEEGKYKENFPPQAVLKNRPFYLEEFPEIRTGKRGHFKKM